jgi:hypothetical protein
MSMALSGVEWKWGLTKEELSQGGENHLAIWTNPENIMLKKEVFTKDCITLFT